LLLRELGRRHPFFGIRMGDARDEFALLGLPGKENPVAIPVICKAGAAIQPQLPLSRRRVRPVTLHAMAGEDRLDVAIEKVSDTGRGSG